MMDRDTSKVVTEGPRPLLFCDECHCYFVRDPCKHTDKHVTIDPQTMRKALPRKRIDD